MDNIHWTHIELFLMLEKNNNYNGIETFIGWLNGHSTN